MTLEDFKAIAAGVIIFGSLAALWWLDQGDRMERYLGPILGPLGDFVGRALKWVATLLLWLVGLIIMWLVVCSIIPLPMWLGVLIAVVGLVAFISEEQQKTRDAINRRHDHDYY